MKFWLTIAGIGAVALSIAPVRALIKRIRMAWKIKKCCRKMGYTLTRVESILSLNRSERITFQIEKGNTVFLVKLFGSLHKLETFYLNTDGTYHVERFIPLIVGRGGSVSHTKVGKKHPFPEIDWFNGEAEDYGKRYIPILLFCPVPMEVRVVRGKEDSPLISEGTVGDGYLKKLKKRPLNSSREFGGWASGGYSYLKGSSQLHSGETFNGAYIYGTQEFLRILESEGRHLD